MLRALVGRRILALLTPCIALLRGALAALCALLLPRLLPYRLLALALRRVALLAHDGRALLLGLLPTACRLLALALRVVALLADGSFALLLRLLAVYCLIPLSLHVVALLTDGGGALLLCLLPTACCLFALSLHVVALLACPLLGRVSLCAALLLDALRSLAGRCIAL